ncbi:hypothetical protein RGUI_1723 [Rhodovulum sp. P5]|uniref:hypothetical protein n=1 Tax=Rhodovulum sp. P5 TaxID=1564506 RepID=UPI0009C1CFFF|nr:hypothetical protein [Rhodovulum sp. P5]ARE39864.1 hypothetical protein RGUI_1723 [Rhodovulum sp. P5]
MTEKSAMASLPAEKGSKAPSFGWIKRARKLAPANGKLSVVEMKKAAKVLQGIGKPVSGIEAMPDGSFRVLVQHSEPAPPPDSNPWDEVLPDGQE